MEIDLRPALAVEGWMDPPELEYLARLSFSLPPGSVIAEIGSFKGRSANALALNSAITLYCVDPWTKYSFADFTSAYGEFLANTAHLANVIPVRRHSVDAAAEFAAKDMRFDVIFLDGDHEAAHVRADIEAWRPLLKDGGILCGHDYLHPTWPDVEIVVKELVPRFRVIPNTLIWTTEEAHEDAALHTVPQPA